MAKRIEKLTDLRPDSGNANLGTERGQYMLDESIAQVGAARSIVADRDGVVIAGNKTLHAAVDAGLGLKVVRTDGNDLVVVQRIDLDLDGEGEAAERARKAAYFDNRSSEVGLAWDAQQIAADIAAGMDLAPMFGDDELAELLSALAPEAEPDPGAQIDKAAELQEKWQTALGQVWEVGRHRIACGDCTDAAVVEGLMQGEKAGAVVTDPPYGIGVDYGCFQDTVENVRKLIGRAMPLIFEHLPAALTPGVPAMWDYPRPAWVGSWVHPASTSSGPWGFIGSNPILYYGSDPYLAAGKGRRDSSLVLVSDRAGLGDHPVSKPLDVWTWLVKRMTPGSESVVLDPFLGSGTTVVVCEQLGRIGRGIELSPAYIAVSLERLAGMGLEPRLVEAG